jgi:hypothetical protein
MEASFKHWGLSGSTKKKQRHLKVLNSKKSIL